jgi:hypothetical protein
MILAGQLASAAEVERFQREAQLAAQLQHTYIVAIHEVGAHKGQHYFSMDYVEGQSLADMVRDAPLPPARAVRYVQLAAEAIHAAHVQGILHRDLKPSNILIDAADQPRITDIGLARFKGGEHHLTATGAVIGTPSYMPSEQASADRGKLGPASDVYALGAVLYELVTGRPPFRAATAIDTVLQVLSADPAAPRLLNPQIDRDLETLILKCLAKEPVQRYPTAAALAEDLHAYREGRPIQARRPGAAERTWRWLRRQRRTALLTAATAAASVLVVVGTLIGWNWYTASHQAHLAMSTADAYYLKAEITETSTGAEVMRFTVPTQEYHALAPGDYQLRLGRPGQLSETYRFYAQPHQLYDFQADLLSRQLWETPLDANQVAEVIQLGEKTDGIIAGPQGLRRVDGATGKSVWPGEWVPLPAKEAVQPRGEWFGPRLQEPRHVGQRSELPTLVQPAPKLEPDSTGDLVWASRYAPALLAFSGKTGRMLWYYRSRPVLPPGVDEGQVQNWGGGGLGDYVVGQPLTANSDEDDVPDLIATFVSGPDAILVGKPPHLNFVNLESQCRMEAISGRTGRSLWRHNLGTSSYLTSGNVPPQAAVLTQRQGKAVALVAVGGMRVATLDLRTGKEAAPSLELKGEPFGAPQLIDRNRSGTVNTLIWQKIENNEFMLEVLSPGWTGPLEDPVDATHLASVRPI